MIPGKAKCAATPTRPRPRPDLKVAYYLVWLVSVTPYITGLKTKQILTLEALSEQKFLVKFASQNCLNYL
jgi:hypothetical protein